MTAYVDLLSKLTLEEKNQYSHRAKALKKLYTILKGEGD